MKPAVLVTGLFLLLVSAGHVLRLLMRVDVIVADIPIPMWPSVVAIIVPAGLAVWLWREQRPPSTR
ncbi:MAG: hypothetical protein OER21_02175 [Gemmatimonadota bacterium]|nr:hypothetical protein [Gemmatimonadota bacterium]